MVPNIWLSAEVKTMETLKKTSGLQELGEGRDEQVLQKGFLGQWKYSIWYYNGGYILHIRQNS